MGIARLDKFVIGLFLALALVACGETSDKETIRSGTRKNRSTNSRGEKGIKATLQSSKPISSSKGKKQRYRECVDLKTLVRKIKDLKGQDIRVYTNDIRLVTESSEDSKVRRQQTVRDPVAQAHMLLRKNELVYSQQPISEKAVNEIIANAFLASNIEQSNCETIQFTNGDTRGVEYSIDQESFNAREMTLTRKSGDNQFIRIRRQGPEQLLIDFIQKRQSVEICGKEQTHDIVTSYVIDWGVDMAEVGISPNFAKLLSKHLEGASAALSDKISAREQNRKKKSSSARNKTDKEENDEESTPRRQNARNNSRVGGRSSAKRLRVPATIYERMMQVASHKDTALVGLTCGK